MEKFIALSPASKKVLSIAQMSAALPVNIIILGEIGVGRKLLAKTILPEAQTFDAKELEKLIIEKKIDLKQFDTLIVYDINKVLNKEDFLDNLKNIRIVATSFLENYDYNNSFAVKIEIPSLDQRQEDLDELIKIYIKEANRIYKTSKTIKDVKIDLSGNGVTLKQSIYKSILFHSVTKQDMMNILYNFFIEELKKERSYKDLLEVFEIPLLNASKVVYKSQLKISQKLKINRVTLRKKLTKYFGE